MFPPRDPAKQARDKISHFLCETLPVAGLNAIPEKCEDIRQEEDDITQISREIDGYIMWEIAFVTELRARNVHAQISHIRG